MKPEGIAGKGCHVGTNQGGASGILRSLIDACERFPKKLISSLGVWAQRFMFRRGFSPWLMRQLIMWGCVISALITFPLVFGWVHFELEGDLGYRA